MKRTILSAFLFVSVSFMLAGCSISPARIGLPLDNPIAQVGVGVKLLPKADNFTLVRLAPFWFGDDFVTLANVSAISTSETNNGVAVGGVLIAEDGVGLSVAGVDYNKDHIGVRMGGFVLGERQRGIQLGLVNYCSSDSRVLQIGLLNIVEDAPCPLPLFNFCWQGPKED